MAILVCGGAGYIGSHAVHQLVQKGESVVIVDNLPPVFHTEKANTAQIKVMQVVFDTLQDSGIDFAVVQRDGQRKDELVIKGYGDFDLNEKGEILAEVVEMYMDDKTINHISME